MNKYLVKHTGRYYYKKIQEYYKGKTAKRSRLPYMNHIDEGITILEVLRAPHFAIEAFALHPMFQGDEDLKENHYDKELHHLMGTRVMQYVMEYRNVANNFLSKDFGLKEPKLSPIVIVNWMLLADKIQNYKDFLKYQSCKGKNATMSKERWDTLDAYFQSWLQLLLPYFQFEWDKELALVWKIIDPEEEQYGMVS